MDQNIFPATEIKSNVSIRAVELALQEDEVKNKERVALHRAPLDGQVEKASTLSKLLRVSGAVTILGAALVFLTQHVGLHSGDAYYHIERYGAFLGLTLLLAVAGFFCGLKVHEDKGARTFLAIVAAIIPVHFLQLGGIVYSRFIINSGKAVYYPELLHLTAPNDLAALITVLAASLVIVPMLFISFSALMRSHAKTLTTHFFMVNALLLLPVRDPNISIFLALGMLFILRALDYGRLREAQAIKTTEGTLVRLILPIPVLAIVGRALFLYYFDLSYFIAAIICASVAFFLFDFVPSITKNVQLKFCSQFLSAVPAVLAWEFLLMEFLPRMTVGAELRHVLATIPPCLILAGMSFFAISELKSIFRNFAAIAAVVSVTSGMNSYPGVVSSFMCLATSILIASYGVSKGSNALFSIGVIGMGVGLLYNVRYAIQLYSYSPWLSLALLGTAAVVGSSYVERNKGVFGRRVREAK